MKHAFTLLALATTLSAHAQTDNYYFGNTLGEAGSGPALTQVVSCGAATGSYSPSTITTSSGQCGTGTQTVFNFNEGGGLSYPNGAITGTYTIHVFFKFNLLSGYQRLIDLKNGITDDGLYIQNKCLRFFPTGTVGPCIFNPNTYYLLSLVRDGATDSVDVYVNGSIFVSNYHDSTGLYEAASTSTPIIFFRDDLDYTCEDRAGSIKFLSLKPSASTSAEVASTFTNICAIALSAGITGFSGQRQGGTHQLHWSVDGEKGLREYAIERGADGKEWRTIGSVPAGAKARYSFTDAAPLAGTNYYRLRSRSLDGSEGFSNTLSLHNSTAGAAWTLATNPVRQRIEAHSSNASAATASLFNMQGQEVWSGTAADGRIRIDAAGLPAGAYSLLCRQGGTQEALRVMVVHW